MCNPNLPVAISNGRRMNTVSQLNMSCTVAPAKALLNSPLSEICPMATMVLVTEVPMLAPISMGMDVLMSRTVRRKP